MSDSNSPGRPGAGDSGEQSWPEYLSRGSTQGANPSGNPAGAGPAGPGGPAGPTGSSSASSASSSSSSQEPPGAPRRVIGTPPPAEARTMLPEQGNDGDEPRPRELPAGPDNPAQAKKATRIVAAIFTLAFLAGAGFIASYVIFGTGTVAGVQHSNWALGGTLGGAFLFLGIGAIIWVRHIMPNVELTEDRHRLASSEENKEAFKETFEEGADASGFVSRPVLRRTLIAATVPLAVAPIVLLRDMGPLPRRSLDSTVWRKGLRLMVYGTGRPITSAEFSSPGSIISVGPQGFLDDDDAMAKAATIIIKFRPGELQPPTNLNWTVDNIVAYSKICTHVGCPAALYEQTTHHILCPCHQSTFDAAHGAKVIFGPATRPLPQLPMGVDSEGFLIALSDFHEPVGPSYWERS